MDRDTGQINRPPERIGIERRPYKYGNICIGDGLHTRSAKKLLDLRHTFKGELSMEQMIDGQHTVRLATTE